MSFGRSGAALCKEIVDHLDDPGLPQFNAELVRRVHAEAKEHAEHIEALKDEVRRRGILWPGAGPWRGVGCIRHASNVPALEKEDRNAEKCASVGPRCEPRSRTGRLSYQGQAIQQGLRDGRTGGGPAAAPSHAADLTKQASRRSGAPPPWPPRLCHVAPAGPDPHAEPQWPPPSSCQVRKLGGEWKEARAVDAEGTDALHAAVVVHHESVLRNKRCLMAYQHARTQRLMALRHALGPVLPTDVTEALSRAEREFVGGHSKLLRQYAKATGVDLATHRTPPAEAFIEVRCLRDGGDIYTEDGAVTLAKNSIHRLRRSEAEALIAQGVLEQVKSF